MYTTISNKSDDIRFCFIRVLYTFDKTPIVHLHVGNSCSNSMSAHHSSMAVLKKRCVEIVAYPLYYSLL